MTVRVGARLRQVKHIEEWRHAIVPTCGNGDFNGKAGDMDMVPIEQEPRHHLVIENEFVRAFAVEITPQDRTLCHHHPHDYLLYVVGDGDIVSAARDEEPKK